MKSNLRTRDEKRINKPLIAPLTHLSNLALDITLDSNIWKIRKKLNRNVNYNNMLKNFIKDTWEDLSLSKAFKYLKPGHCRILRSKRNNGSSGSKSIHWADLEAQRLWRNSQRYHAHQSHATFHLEPICQANQTGKTGCWAKRYFTLLVILLMQINKFQIILNKEWG